MPILSKVFDPSERTIPKTERTGVPLVEILKVEQSYKNHIPIDPKVFKKPNRAVHGKIRKMKPAA